MSTKVDPKAVLVSGANGYLGKAVCQYFTNHNCRVRALVRDPAAIDILPGVQNSDIYRCELPERIDSNAFNGAVETLIHCAWDMDSGHPAEARKNNILGMKNLIALSRQHGVRQVAFISSLSAHPDAVSIYGKSKLEAEQLLDTKIDLIFKLGLVVGEGGLFTRMKESIKKFPVVPLFFGGKQKIQIIHLDDVCSALYRATFEGISGVYHVAYPDTVDVREFYRSLAESINKKCFFIRAPGNLSLHTLRILERFGFFSLPVTSENLLGLKSMKTFNTSKDLALLGIPCRRVQF